MTGRLKQEEAEKVFDRDPLGLHCSPRTLSEGMMSV